MLCGCGVAFKMIQALTDEEEFNKLYSENGFVEINAVCQCRVNEWCGSRNPQLLLVDYEVVDSVAFIF